MIPIPDISQTYPKTGLTMDAQFTGSARFVSDGSSFFDGSNDFVNCGDHANSQMTTGDFSVTFWAKFTGTGEYYIVSKQDGASDYDGYRFGFNAGKTRSSLAVDFTNKTSDVNGNRAVNDGVWHHFAYTVDRSGNLVGYIDGKVDKTTDISSISGSIDPDEDLILGASYSGANQNFSGHMANVGIFKGVVLTQAQIVSIMQANSYNVAAAVQAPSLYYILSADYNDSTGSQNGTNSGSVLSPVRVRLPLGYDSSGNLNNAFPFDARAVVFDGTADYISCGAGVDLSSTGGSISVWVKPDSVAGGDQIIFETDGGGNRFAVQMDNAVFQVSWYPTATYRGVASVPVQAGEWYHIVGTIDDSNNTALYVNGVAQSATYSTMGHSGTGITGIGALVSSPSRWFGGSISCAKLFNVELTAAQAAELYHSPERVLPSGVSAANLKRFYALADYTTTSADSINGLYLMDSGADGVHGLAYGGAMDRKEKTECPQLGLMNTSALVHFPGDKAIGDSAQWHGYTADWSASFWVFLEDGDHSAFIWEGGGYNAGSPYNGSQRFNLQIFSSSGDMALIFYHDDNGSITAAVYDKTSDFPTGEWLHIGVSFKNSDGSVQLFYEGTKRTDTTPVGNSGSGSSFAFGARYVYSGGTAQSFHKGYIANVGFWNEILDDDEFAALHTAGVGHKYQNATGNYDSQANLTGYYYLETNCDMQPKVSGSYPVMPDLEYYPGGNKMNLSIVPEGGTDGQTPFGFTREKVSGNAVFNFGGFGYFQIPHAENLNPTKNNGFTVSLWFKMRNLTNGAVTALLEKGTSNDRWYLQVRDDTGGDPIQFNFGDGSGTTDISGGSLADNDWHHIVVALESSGSAWTSGKLYRDGALLTTEDISARNADTPTTDDLYIASDDGSVEFDGSIAFLKIYERALSLNEVKLLYQSNARTMRYIEDV